MMNYLTLYVGDVTEFGVEGSELNEPHRTRCLDAPPFPPSPERAWGGILTKDLASSV